MQKNSRLLIFIFPILFCSCDWFTKKPTPTPVVTIPDFETTPKSYLLPTGVADEASGLCDSRSMAGNVWVHEDGDNPNLLYQFSHTGQFKGQLKMPFPNRDWEDISIGAGPESGKNYIYLADIGDNNAAYENQYYVYRFLEPQSLSQQVSKYDRIAFQYPDGSRDAECILLDPTTKDIYIVTKREFNVRIYQLPYPQSVTEVQTAKFIQAIPYLIITSGGISTDGKEIVLRNYDAIYYWYLKDTETIISALARNRDKLLPYLKETQGEGFCFDKDNKGYFTNSERGGNSTTPNYLNYFAKK
ncbi:hypothetical protein EMA8858_03993 [Emticicia aquatica]|jgi:hypothetical protein|uniref:PE-PGRS family protein n=1 Tax=Emticicia aquatica TaxID=1681835 RepID=A0ABN8EZ38_9BACT|nr:PE-PGRS family protein [Emticicia aquatica]CAH0997859.1 hypothetical protein EMA8858_03993 [Emticicia aquatica]